MTEQWKKVFAALALSMGAATAVFGHCQIPCGIYGDATRFALMREHVTTIRKSMTEINRMSKEKSPTGNQMVRWVENKESHADELADIVTSYFMAQRIKSVSDENKTEHAKYVDKLTLLHQILVASMKAKQTTDEAVCTQLGTLIDRFEKAYNNQ